MSYRDFTLSCYNSSLWIKDILSLMNINNKFFHKRDDGAIVPVKFVTIFGTIVGARFRDEKWLYSVDDGTGTISCRYKHETKEELENWDIKDLTLADESQNETLLQEVSTMSDSVFNDRTVQQEEIEANKMAITKALDSLRWSLIDSVRSSEAFNLGETVCVHGRVYSYFGTPQLYTNAIRPITMSEELTLMIIKLEDGCVLQPNKSSVAQQASKKVEEGCSVTQMPKKVKCMPNTEEPTTHSRRPSGLMTFDTVERSDWSVQKIHEIAKAEAVLPPSPVPELGILAVPKSSPHTQPTFDTLNPNDSSSSDSDLFIPETPNLRNKNALIL